jgi:hypothetical protein
MLEGIRFVGMRNEQSASYAANAWGFIFISIIVLFNPVIKDLSQERQVFA